jgi:UDP-GlcNAc:undecaprenyl-phosphate GlcNAc-1-phosphate transferase
MSVVLAGSTIGFLIWNRPPARIYMGDAGSLFLGILVASLTIRLDTNSQLGRFGLLIPILLLAVPIMDTSVAILKRVARGVSPFEGGQDHLSHRLMRKGLSKRSSVLVLWFLSLVFGLLAIGVSLLNARGAVTAISFGSALWTILFLWFFNTSDGH